jgi:hypothetical protein
MHDRHFQGPPTPWMGQPTQDGCGTVLGCRDMTHKVTGNSVTNKFTLNTAAPLSYIRACAHMHVQPHNFAPLCAHTTHEGHALSHMADY